MTLAFLLFIVGPFLVVGWISAYKASDSMKDEWGRTTLQLVRQNHMTIEKTMASVNGKSTTFLNNHFFGVSGVSFWTDIETLGEIREADKILESWSSDGTDFSLYMRNANGVKTPIDLSGKQKGFKYLDPDGRADPDWIEHAIKSKGAGTFRLIQESDGTTDVRFTRSILNPQKYDEIVGFLIISNLKVLLTRDLVSVRLPDHAGIFLYNELNEQLMSTGSTEPLMNEIPERLRKESEGYFFDTRGGQRWLFAFSHSAAFDTLLVYQVPADSITGSQTVFQWLIMILSAIYLAIVLIFVLYLVRMIVKPLARLVSITKIYEPGKKLDTGEGELLRSDEFGILYGAFLKMTRRLDHLFEENYLMELKQKENELSTLHSQITPHLLYNTLDSIYWYALENGNEDVGNMVKDLSKLLRIGLSKGKTIITIGEEIEHAGAYSRLQAMRYPNAFEVRWDIEEGVQSYLTPKVILQPLVENAIFHGVSGMDGEGEVAISVRREEGEIRMIVADNGFVPVDVDRLNRIARGEEGEKGYGIRNVHQRVQLHFGEAYGLRYERQEGGGVRAILNLPAREPL
ncbi:sensor histidine kinase [Cohnella cellulosilytica]|uniref:Sensor histidine kinase n=1 Tax=Cohnella cellulosilytica TaxID=986710 RepID=A0ABW2FE74_9BACL